MRNKRATIRRPIKPVSNNVYKAVSVLKIVVICALIGAGIVLMILFGFPFIEDIIKDVDPTLRYQKKIEANFDFTPVEQKKKSDLISAELYLSQFKLKNEPFMDDLKIVFTTQNEKKSVTELDALVLYNVISEEAEILPNIEKKYDNLMSPVMAGNFIVFIDSMTNGGGRILGYDLQKQEQFLIKEYAYAIPRISIAGNTIAFMQWAGDDVQRLYVYDVVTREGATVKLYEKTTSNSNVSISKTDMVWSEYDKGKGLLKRIVLDSDGSKYENYDFGQYVFEPKTNGKDIVFATKEDIINGDLMLSVGGQTPVHIASNVANYGLGTNFVVYTKEDKVFLSFTDSLVTKELSTDITQNILASVNGGGVCYYDITDGVLTDEVVKYLIVE